MVVFLSTLAPCLSNIKKSISLKRDTTIYYTIRPVPLVDRTNLEISIRFQVYKDTSLLVKLPKDYYSVPDLHKYVVSFEGMKGTKISMTANQDERLVQPNKKHEVCIKYVLSYDPAVMDGFSFGPNVGPSYFHLAGCQWMLPIGDISSVKKYIIKIVDAPKDWRFYSSLSPNPSAISVTKSYENLISSAIGGGAQAHQKFSIYGKPLYVFVAGKYHVKPDAIFKAVNKIVSLQREWFEDYDFPYFTVSILPRSGIIAGTAIPNLFVCFVKPETTEDDLNGLISHEMFHTWLPNKIQFVLPKGESRLKYEWFTEGVADYFSRKILLDAGLISQERFVHLVNQDLINSADNPYRSATYPDFMAASKKGGTAHKKISYYRGALIALNWETTVQRFSPDNQLKDLIKTLYHTAKKSNGKLEMTSLYEICSTYGINFKDDLEKFIVQGLPIRPLSNTIGTSYALQEVVIPLFNPSFSLEQTFKSRKIEGVQPNGVAFKAGLRNGMELVKIQNSGRFVNGWSPDRPLSVTVLEEGLERTIEYYPHGEEAKLMLYRAAK